MSSVDVVVPCYNYARYLSRCVDALLSQRGVYVRVLIIDDASTDDTPRVGTELAARDARVLFTRHEKNFGHIETYNEGVIGWASGDYTLLLSPDDLLAPGALHRAARVMDEHVEVGMTYGMALLFSGEEELESYPAGSDEYQLVPGDAFLRRSIAGNPVPTPAAVVRTRMQKQVGGYNVSLPHSGDMEMWMRFARRGPIGVVRAVQALKRVHSNNMSFAYSHRAFSDMRERIEACRLAFSGGGASDSELSSWMAYARHVIGNQAFWHASRLFDQGDSESCRQCLQLAIQILPQLRDTSQWQRLRRKRMLPSLLWRTIRPVVDKMRGVHAVSAPSALQPNACFPRRQIGWWPHSQTT